MSILLHVMDFLVELGAIVAELDYRQQAQDVKMTSIQRHFNVVCLLGPDVFKFLGHLKTINFPFGTPKKH